MALNDVYRITLSELFEPTDKVCLNVFYYKQITEAPADGANALRASFDPFITNTILAIQNDRVSIIQVLVENIVPSADNSQNDYVPGTVAGTRIGDCLPVFNSWTFRLNRATNASRHGRKAFVGVSEADQDDGEPIGSMSPLLSNVSSALQQIIGGPLPGVATYAPVIFRAGKPGKTIPEKIVPPVVQANFPVATANFTAISTQNTRKT